IETFRHALDSLKQRDRDWAVRSYETRALWQYSIAIIDLRMGDTVAGREALERTVLEDRTYYPAYVRLAVLNAEAGKLDDATAEFERAVRANPSSYAVRMAYGHYLALLPRYEEADVQMTRAVELEPYAAAAQLLLARVREARQLLPEAIAAYDRYLAIAARRDPGLQVATARAAQLRRLSAQVGGAGH